MRFTDRTEAGRRLAPAVARRVEGPAIVLALPRGGVPVAAEVADVLGAPLDVIVVRKVGMPGHEQLGVGAVDESGGMVLDHHALERLGLRWEDIEATVAAERRKVARGVALYRDGRPLPDLEGRTVIIVDDGLATGVTATAAVRAVRDKAARRVVLAVPVASRSGYRELSREVDELICLEIPERFGAVGQWYQDFSQTTDEEVLEALTRARQAHRHRATR